MQLVLDNIVAIMITSTVLLILMGVMHMNQQAQVEASSYYAMKTRALGFIDLLEGDLQNADSVITTNMDLAGMNTFAFYSKYDTTTTDALCVRYQVNATETRAIRDTTIQLYQVKRYQGPRLPGCPLGSLTAAGASPATITKWNIHALNKSDQPITEPIYLGDTRAIATRFSIWSPYKTDPKASVKETTWSLTFRPPMMQKHGAVYL